MGSEEMQPSDNVQKLKTAFRMTRWFHSQKGKQDGKIAKGSLLIRLSLQ